MRRITLLPIALLACRSVAPAIVRPPTTAALAETPPPAPDETPRVRAREFAPMPRCEASDALTVARTTAGVAAEAALARRGDGGLAAFLAIPAGERVPRLMLTALGAQGVRQGDGDVALLDAGESPGAPALLAVADGYLLAWRSGPPGRQQVRLRTLDARGVPAGPVRTLGRAGFVGAITLRAVGAQTAVAFASRDDRHPNAGRTDETPWAPTLSVHLGERVVEIAAPPGGAFTGEAPRLTGGASGLRVWALSARADGTAADEHALLTRRVDTDDALHLVARDLDHVDALAQGDHTLLTWRARVARHDVALRAAMLGEDLESDAPPVTLATFRGAAGMRPTVFPLGGGPLGVFALARLADDATASVNVAALDAQGAPLGRAPALTSTLVRSAAVALSPAPEGSTDPLAWALLDGRDSADGRPTLLLTRVGCDPQRPVPALDLHPGAWVQRLAAPEAAPVDLAHLEGVPVAMSCETRATRPFVTHVSGDENDALRGSTAALRMTPAGAQLWAVIRTEQGRTRLVTTTVNAAGLAAPPRTVREGDVGLPPEARPLDALLPAGRLRDGDTVLDGMRQGTQTVALLGRADPVADDVARTVALARGDTLDPFADPLGHPRGAVLLGPGARDEAGALGMLFTDQNVLRRSEIVDGVARAPRSLLQALPGGGGLLAGAWSGAARWVVLATGEGEEGRSVGALTLVRVEREGVRGVTRLFPEDGSVIPQQVSLGVAGERVVVLFPRAEQGGAVTWSWADLRCAVPGGAR